MIGTIQATLRELITIATMVVATNALAAPMTVHVEKPDFYGIVMHDPSWTMSLSGEIDLGAPARVAAGLREVGEHPVNVYIDSPGGNLYAGMEIGRLLRNAGANTHVGKIIVNPPWPKGDPFPPAPLTQPGGCYSACSLAFLGGVYRYMVKGSEFGVHRVSKSGEPSRYDLDIGQLISSDESRYIREMGVDPSLFDLMATQSERGIYVLSDGELNALNVTNNGRQKPEWTIEEAASGLGQYLRGSQDTVYGLGKILFFCVRKSVVMDSFYQVGSKANRIVKEKWVHSLKVDREVIPLPSPNRVWVDGEDIRAIFVLTNAQAMKIASSKLVGHAMQVSRDAPIFVGYVVDIPPSAAPKVHGFIENCVDASNKRGGND